MSELLPLLSFVPGSWGSKEDKMSPAPKLGPCACPQPTLDKYLQRSTQGPKPWEIQVPTQATLLYPQGT